MNIKKVLFINQEIIPYVPETPMSTEGRMLTQSIQESGREIRTFLPQWGCINERRNQLHEVIRLSGMNIIIDGNDHPLIIKVASIQAAHMQVYFIDNDDYFEKRGMAYDPQNEEYDDAHAILSFEVDGYFGKYGDYYVVHISYELEDLAAPAVCDLIIVSNIFVGYECRDVGEVVVYSENEGILR